LARSYTETLIAVHSSVTIERKQTERANSKEKIINCFQVRGCSLADKFQDLHNTVEII